MKPDSAAALAVLSNGEHLLLPSDAVVDSDRTEMASSSVKSTRDASRPLASSHLGRARRLGTSVDASRRRRDARRGEGRRKRRRKIYMFYSSELLCAKGALGQIWVRGASRERD